MCLTCDTALNPNQLDTFGERFLNILNHGALASMIAIGHRTGLFDALYTIGRCTSADLASHAGLNERYVREWLGVMVCGGVVDCDADGHRFHLPAAHGALLAPTAGDNSLAHLAQYITLIGSVEEPLVECFRRGGGVPYSAFPRFHEIMAADSKQTVVDPLFEAVLPLVPGLALSLLRGVEVLDVGCGRGKALLALAAAYPNSRFTGWDLSRETTTAAQQEAGSLGLSNISFEQRDLSDFHLTAPAERFDFITAFDAIHDQARPDHVLAGIRRALKADGAFLMQDIGASSNIAENRDHPIGTLLYSLSCAHCMTVSLAQGGLGVGAMWGEALTREFLAAAGFSRIDRHTLDHDLQNYYYVVRP